MNRKLALVIAASAILALLSLLATPPLSPQETPSIEYRNARASVQYVGDEVCAECHKVQYDSFKKTGMGNSLSRPQPANLFEFTKAVILPKTRLGRTYAVSLKQGKLIHSETKMEADGQQGFTETHEVAFTVGSGYFGRSYLIQRGDALFVSPISYYSRIKKWDLSPGYEAGQFASFLRPAGDLCVGCHSGLSRPIPGTRNRFLSPPFRLLAIGCERCHGPGEVHVRERKANTELKEAVDHSIVNPQRLAWQVRDDVCNQCHLAGDARVMRPGKNYLDFRPGLLLDSVVSIFGRGTAGDSAKIKALSHPEQLAMSRCTIASNGKLGCITCHDPHVKLVSNVATTSAFRRKCLTCHTTQSCALPAAKRQNTSPPDNCIQCHMPKRPTSNIDHSAMTDHRIPRVLVANAGNENKIDATFGELRLLTAPASGDGKTFDLRTRALAYYELAQLHPEYQKPGFELLEQAAKEFPEDVEVQTASGLVLMLARPQAPEAAAAALRKAIELGSKSAEVRVKLARLELRLGNERSGESLYEEAIAWDKYYTPAYLGLADYLSSVGEGGHAKELLDRVLKFDPGNEAVRKRLAER